MTRRLGLAVLAATLAAYVLLSGYGIDRGYPTALYALTVALVEERTTCLDGQREILGYDHAIRDGRLYSDKAPGPAFLMIPAYLLARAVTADPDLRFTLTLLLGLTLPVATAPLGVALLIVRTGGADVLLGALGFAFASLFFPYATVGVSDPLAACAVAWAYALGVARDGRLLWLSGAMAGLAVLTRYQAVLLVTPLVIATVLSRRRASVPFLAPLLVAVGLLLAYHAAAFGHPLALPTRFWRGGASVPTLMFGAPTAERIFAMTFGTRRGIFVFTPVLLLAPVGAVVLLRSAWRTGLAVVAALLAYFGFLACNAGFGGGADYGMRFSVDALPLLWVLVHAAGGVAARRLRGVLYAPSLALALLPALAGPHVPLKEPRPIACKARELWQDGPRTILQGAPRSPAPPGAP